MQSLSTFVVGPPKRMDVFSAPTIGSAEAIQGRGSTAGTSTDIIYPVSKLVKGQFQPGRTLEFNWKSSPERWWHPKSTRLVVHYKACFGEVDSTCRDASTGPTSSNGVRPSKSVSLTPLPNTSLFGTGQVRYTNNGVVLYRDVEPVIRHDLCILRHVVHFTTTINLHAVEAIVLQRPYITLVVERGVELRAAHPTAVEIPLDLHIGLRVGVSDQACHVREGRLVNQGETAEPIVKAVVIWIHLFVALIDAHTAVAQIAQRHQPRFALDGAVANCQSVDCHACCLLREVVAKTIPRPPAHSARNP